MILDAVEALTALAPGLTRSHGHSVALLRTATPLVLFFDANRRAPVYVLQFGERERLERINSVLSRLHPMIPDLVPEPLVCAAWGRDRHVLVQSGLPGRPWFGLELRERSRKDWEGVLEKSGVALERLHEAVRQVAEWISVVNPAAELRGVVSRLEALGVELPRDTAEIAEIQAGRLEALGEVAGHSQHGDYCLNNVLLGEESVGILDFEDFGRTSMPLQDQIGLSLSVSELGSEAGAPDRAEALAVSVNRGPDTYGPRQLQALVLHYLLWRVEQAHGVKARSAKEAALLRQIAEFVEDPESFWPGR